MKRIILLLMFCAVGHLAVVQDAGYLASAQVIRVSDNVVANPPGGGWYPWYEMHSDPDNPKNLLICGSRLNARENAFKSFVYYSADGGKTWQQAFEDTSGNQDGEQSCAYGVNGVAYLVSCATKVIDGEWHHEFGTTRIYISGDSGKTWTLGITTGWTDYSTSAVDINPGADQNRLYLFFNGLTTFYNSLGKKDLLEVENNTGVGTRVGMISYKAGDLSVAGPFSSPAMAIEKYHGSYPAPAFVLKDGSVLGFYTAGRRTAKGTREYIFAVVRASPDRTALEAPVKIVDSLDSTENSSNVDCGRALISSAAYNDKSDVLYFAYPDVRDGKCQLFLTASNDGGKTWLKPQMIQPENNSVAHLYRNVAIAVTQDGQLGVLWQDRARSGCWSFAVSIDGGQSLSGVQELGTCSEAEAKPSALNSAYLWTSFFQADSSRVGSTARIALGNAHNSAWRDEDAIAVTSDGDFHPVWIDPGSGNGEIRTAAIHVISPSADTLVATATKGLENVTSLLRILYGGDQHYDAASEILTLDVSIKNNTDQPLRGPFRLAVIRLYRDYGSAEIANSDNNADGAGSVWDLDKSIPGGTLAPGATSRPYTLKFHYHPDRDQQRDSDDILGFSAKVFAARPAVQSSTGQAADVRPVARNR
jgi:hypothetical protein